MTAQLVNDSSSVGHRAACMIWKDSRENNANIDFTEEEMSIVSDSIQIRAADNDGLNYRLIH